VIVSLPFQSALGTAIVATLSVIETERFILPEKVQVICPSVLSGSDTYPSRLIVVKEVPSAIVWLGISATTGGSLTAVTVKVAASLSDNPPGSPTVNVIVSDPFQSAFGKPMVATLETIDTESWVFPE